MIVYSRYCLPSRRSWWFQFGSQNSSRALLCRPACRLVSHLGSWWGVGEQGTGTAQWTRWMCAELDSQPCGCGWSPSSQSIGADGHTTHAPLPVEWGGARVQPQIQRSERNVYHYGVVSFRKRKSLNSVLLWKISNIFQVFFSWEIFTPLLTYFSLQIIGSMSPIHYLKVDCFLLLLLFRGFSASKQIKAPLPVDQ